MRNDCKEIHTMNDDINLNHVALDHVQNAADLKNFYEEMERADSVRNILEEKDDEKVEEIRRSIEEDTEKRAQMIQEMLKEKKSPSLIKSLVDRVTGE